MQASLVAMTAACGAAALLAWPELQPVHAAPLLPPRQGERVEANARFLSTAQWCDEVASTLTLLGGLSLLHAAPGAMHLKLVTPYPTTAVRSDDPGPCATADHELSLHLADDGAGGLGWFGCCSVMQSGDREGAVDRA